MIKPIDQERDRSLVMHRVDRASELSNELADFKGMAGDVARLHRDELRGVRRQDRRQERATSRCTASTAATKSRFPFRKPPLRRAPAEDGALIDECLAEWTQGARPEVVTLVNDAFRTDTKGEIRTARVLALHRLEIADERWQRAMSDQPFLPGRGLQVVPAVLRAGGDGDQYRPISST